MYMGQHEMTSKVLEQFTLKFITFFLNVSYRRDVIFFLRQRACSHYRHKQNQAEDFNSTRTSITQLNLDDVTEQNLFQNM
jgi:hypothetical protein